jgi:hypothetical protein
LNALSIFTFDNVDLSVLARNKSLAALRTMTIVVRDFGGKNAVPIKTFRKQFEELVNSSGLARIRELCLGVRNLDDTCCELLVKSPMIKHLRQLRLRGDGITDAGAAILDVQRLEELKLEGCQVTEEGYEALQHAGVPMAEEE